MNKSLPVPNPDLLAFWREHAMPGRIGILHIDFIAAKLITWGEKWVTPTGQPSIWTHSFMFLEPKDGIPWIAESDVHVPLPGFRPKPDGPQLNPVSKWSSLTVDRAAVLDTGLNDAQLHEAEQKVLELLHAGYTYRFTELAEAWVAMIKHDLTYTSPLHHEDSMHCGHFLRIVLGAAGCDPFGAAVLPHNTVPELFAQSFPIIAEWTKTENP
jgi:hypothetical protein